MSLAVIYVNGVSKVVKRIGVGSGNVRGLVIVKVFFGVFDLVVIVLLPVIRPQPILDFLPRRDRKIYSIVSLLALNRFA